MHIILFEDELAQQLYPITLGRAAFQVTCGSYRLIDLASRLGEEMRAIARSHLHDLLEADYPDIFAPFADESQPIMLINARLVPAISVIERLKSLITLGRPAVVHTGDNIAAATFRPEQFLPHFDDSIYKIIGSIEEARLESIKIELPLLEYPHDVIRWNSQILAENIADRISQGSYREIAPGVFAAANAHLGQHCVVDTLTGPILLDDDATVSHYSYLCGPVYIGPHTRVNEHAAIKHGVSIGHTCKIGGEIEGTIIEPYTNKQHHGFLGHSYVGSWVNMGAGTCNSDLKNTYGNVSMEYSGHKINTGMQFLGCVIGDYSKIAINTSIFTGKTIGVCSMVYGFATTNVPSFANYARSLGQVTAAPLEETIAAQARMFARRNVVQRPCDVQLIRDMYALTRHEGQLPSGPPKL